MKILREREVHIVKDAMKLVGVILTFLTLLSRGA